MRTTILTSVLCAVLLGAAGNSQAGPIDVLDTCLNINGNLHGLALGCFRPEGETGDPVPAAPGNVTDGLETNFFAPNTGLGLVSIALSEVGDFFVGLVVDWEIEEFFNGFDNESFGSGGSLADGQSFEVDEPGYGDGGYLGDIFLNFRAGVLDGTFMQDLLSGDSGNAPEDISLGLGWDFSLAAGQTAVVNFLLSDTAPDSGFWLSHNDPESNVAFFLSSTLEISGGETEPPVEVPEPKTLLLIGAGLLGAALGRRRQTQQN